MTKNTISTDRITLRPITLNDLEAIHTLHSLPETDEFNALGIPSSIEETKKVIEPWIADNNSNPIKNYTFAIERNADRQFLGLYGFKLGSETYRRAEIWYKVHSDYWGNGIATEASRMILDFGFNSLNLHRIQAGCAVDNVGSIKVLEKIGMTREGRCRQILPLKSGWSDNFEYAILESDER